jgi:hypothetical protein
MAARDSRITGANASSRIRKDGRLAERRSISAPTHQAQTGSDRQALHDRRIHKCDQREQIPLADIVPLPGVRLRQPRRGLPGGHRDQAVESRGGQPDSQTPDPLSWQARRGENGRRTHQNQPKSVTGQQHGERRTASPRTANVMASQRRSRQHSQLEHAFKGGHPRETGNDPDD